MVRSQTSINIKKERNFSDAEQHNLRQRELSYVHKDLTKNNEYWDNGMSVEDWENHIRAFVKEKTGRAVQKKTALIKEAVVTLDEYSTMADLQKLAKAFKEKYDMDCLRIAIHRDEGYKGSKGVKINHHAHIVFSNILSNGKTLKIGKGARAKQLFSEMQDITAEALGMERGVSSNKKHLTALQYKTQQEQKRIEEQAQEKLEMAYEVDKMRDEMDKLRDEKAKLADLTASLRNQVQSLEKDKTMRENEQKRLNSDINKMKQYIEYVESRYFEALDMAKDTEKIIDNFVQGIKTVIKEQARNIVELAKQSTLLQRRELLQSYDALMQHSSDGLLQQMDEQELVRQSVEQTIKPKPEQPILSEPRNREAPKKKAVKKRSFRL